MLGGDRSNLSNVDATVLLLQRKFEGIFDRYAF